MINGHDVVKEASIVRSIIGLVLYPDKVFTRDLVGMKTSFTLAGFMG